MFAQWMPLDRIFWNPVLKELYQCTMKRLCGRIVLSMGSEKHLSIQKFAFSITGKFEETQSHTKVGWDSDLFIFLHYNPFQMK